MKLFNYENMEEIIDQTQMDPLAGHIRGRVVDMDGDPMRRVRVSIREIDRSTYTDDNGNFVIINVPPALYTLIAESEGLFSRSVMTDVPVERGDNPGHLFFMYPQYTRVRAGRRRGSYAVALQMM